MTSVSQCSLPGYQITSLNISTVIHRGQSQLTATDQRYHWQRQGFPEGSSWALCWSHAQLIFKDGCWAEYPQAKQQKAKSHVHLLTGAGSVWFWWPAAGSGHHGEPWMLRLQRSVAAEDPSHWLLSMDKECGWLPGSCSFAGICRGGCGQHQQGDAINRARENDTLLHSSLTWLEVQFQDRSVDSKLRAPVVGICYLTGTWGLLCPGQFIYQFYIVLSQTLKLFKIHGKNSPC